MSTKQATLAESGSSILNLKNFSLLILIAMIAISAYLSYSEAAKKEVACLESSGFNCDTVQKSDWSKFPYKDGIPVAYLGLATNIVLLAILLLEDRIPFLQDNGLILFFIIVLFGFLYSMLLVWVQAARINAYCQWCLAHEALITVLLVVTAIRLRNTIFVD